MRARFPGCLTAWEMDMLRIAIDNDAAPWFMSTDREDIADPTPCSLRPDGGRGEYPSNKNARDTCPSGSLFSKLFNVAAICGQMTTSFPL
jgi:hypothetical protein